MTAAPIRARRVACADLSGATRSAMLALMDRYFFGVTAEVFARDLATKDHAVLLTDAHGAVCGFTTLAVLHTEHDGEPLRVICSGDTVVDESARTGPLLARAWIEAVREVCPPSARSRVLWLLICSSVRTYRFLPLFFREFVPRRGGDSSPADRTLLDVLARRRYGNTFDAASGIVRLADAQPLRPGRHACDAGPDAAWFARTNPGHARGDELVCLCDLGDDNLTAAGRRMLRMTTAERPTAESAR